MKYFYTLIMVIGLWLIPNCGRAAIAYDAVSTFNGNDAAFEHTFSHTVASDDNMILIVGARTVGSGDIVTGITYDGVAMTRAAVSSGAGPYTTYVYFLYAPSTGANNVVVTISESGSCYPRGVSYSGVAQSGQPDATTSGYTASASGFTGTLTTVADNSWAVVMACNGAGNFTAAAGTTIRSGAYLSNAIGDGNSPKTPAGSYSLGMTYSGTAAVSWAMMSFSPAGAAAATPASQESDWIIFN